MLTVTEFLDIDVIQAIRMQVLNKGLDEHDNFSYHAALKEGEKVVGVGRFYRDGDALYVDRVAVTDGFISSKELLFRALLLKAWTLKPSLIKTYGDERGFTDKFGFTDGENGYCVLPENVKFPSCCGGH